MYVTCHIRGTVPHLGVNLLFRLTTHGNQHLGCMFHKVITYTFRYCTPTLCYINNYLSLLLLSSQQVLSLILFLFYLKSYCGNFQSQDTKVQVF